MKKIKTTIISLMCIVSLATFAGTTSNTPPLTKEVIGSGGFKILNVNKIRNFSITNDTTITIDGITQNFANFEVIGSGGYKIRFKVASDVNPTISQGTLRELQLISDIKGPVTSLNPLTVLDQPIFSTGDSIFVNLLNTSELTIGTDVSVSGSIDAINNSLQLSRIEKHTSSLAEWKLRGNIANLTASTFMIGNLTINRNMVTPINCASTLSNNQFVSIKAAADINYSSGSTLTTLTSIECETPDVDQTLNYSIPSVIEGLVSEFINLESFKINDLIIFIDANTQVDNGELEHIDIGSKIEVQGLLNTLNRRVTASTIRFIHHRIKIVAPAVPANINSTSLQLFNKTILATPLTQDDDMVLSSGITSNRQIEVKGFIDSDGQMYGLRIKDKDTADFQDVRLRGDVTAINKPMLEINGIKIDATLSEFEQPSGIIDTDIDAFFSLLQVGMQASIEYATYDNINQVILQGRLEISEMELEDNPDSVAAKSLGGINIKEVIGSGGVGLATLTIPNKIFAAGFE